MKQNYIFILIIGIIISAFLSVDNVFSAEGIGTGGSSGGLYNPLRTTEIATILQKIINYLIKIGAPIVAIMVIYGGFLILTAGDNPEKVTNGKNTILYAAVGYAIILCSWGIIYIIKEILGAR